MSPAVHDALNQFIIQFLSFAGVLATVGGLLLKAYVDRRIKKKSQVDDQAVIEREQSRQIELEQMRQKTAEAQQKASDAELKAEQAQALTEGVANLASTMLQLIQSQNAGFHANAQAISNQAQSIGDLEQSIDRVAGAVVDNTTATKQTGQKADAVVEAINHLEKILNLGIQEIKLIVTPPPTPPDKVIPLNTAPPAELPKASGE